MKGVCALSSAWIGYEEWPAVDGLDAKSEREAFGRTVVPVSRIVGLRRPTNVALVHKDDRPIVWALDVRQNFCVENLAVE